MAEYLTKEEVRQWRSSLEKVTLEEFASRLGKEIKTEKRTHDIVDMIVNKEDVSSTANIETKKPNQEAEKKEVEKKSPLIELTITFKKKLTDREEMVFEYLSQNKGQSVKAKDIATVLNIPRDYIYKYIRNLRKKMEEDLLVNSDEGGFILM